MARSCCFKLLVVALFLISCSLLPGNAQAQSGEQLVTKMHARYKDNWYRTLTFTQQTELYRSDSAFQKSTWYEMVRFPYELRIDVDSVNGGNKTIYTRDSTYRIRNHKLFRTTTEPNPFIFFLGGMYMLSIDSAKSILTRNGYDLSSGGSTNWNGRKTLIAGATSDKDSTHNQFWVDAENLYIVRILLHSGGRLLDVHLSNHVKLPRGWSETSVAFYRDGQLLQTEKYSNLVPDAKLSDSTFDVSRFR